jgi:hypothetical protein
MNIGAVSATAVQLRAKEMGRKIESMSRNLRDDINRNAWWFLEASEEYSTQMARSQFYGRNWRRVKREIRKAAERARLLQRLGPLEGRKLRQDQLSISVRT